MDTKKDIKSLNLEELKTEMESMGEKAFRAKQMYEWMHVKLVRSFDAVSYTHLDVYKRQDHAEVS